MRICDGTRFGVSELRAHSERGGLGVLKGCLVELSKDYFSWYFWFWPDYITYYSRI